MTPRHGQLECAQITQRPACSGKRLTFRIGLYVQQMQIGLRATAVGSDRLVQALTQRRHIRMFMMQHHPPVERHQIDKGVECLHQRIEIAVMIQVFGIDIADYGNRWRQAQERAIGFIGFCHQPRTGTEAGIAAAGNQTTADHISRIKTCYFHAVCNQ